MAQRGLSQRGPSNKVVVEGVSFPGAPKYPDPGNGSSSYLPNPKVVWSLKRSTLGKKHLLHSGYKFVNPYPDRTVNRPHQECIAIYREAFTYGLRFSLYKAILEILTKYELAPMQIVPRPSTIFASSLPRTSYRG